MAQDQAGEINHECEPGIDLARKGRTMEATKSNGTTVQATVQATVLDHGSRWLRPIIPVFAGITSWAILEGDGLARWFHRPGEVVLGVWRRSFEVDEDTLFATVVPELEVVLPLKGHTDLLLEAMATGGATLAVLEWPYSADETPRWGMTEVSTEGLGIVVQLAMRRRS